jgi:predicted dithiol-disulfide oxidoreductase (DUF899 family)
MDAVIETLISAEIMARDNPVRIRGESAEYRAARKTLLIEEIELRRQTERVAAMRGALPPGGPVTGDYRFDTEDGPSDLAGLFGDKKTLVVFNYMSVPSGSGRAQCARTCWTPGTAMPTTSPKARRSW